MNDQTRLENVVYFLIDKTTKAMRRYTHKKLKEAGFDLTIDQFVVLKMLEERSGITQTEMATELFKDNASVTRIIELLVAKKLVGRSMSSSDRRTFRLGLTEEGTKVLENAKPIIFEVRSKGVEHIAEEDLEITKETLKRITQQFS